MQIGMPGRIAEYTLVICKTGQLYSFSPLQNQDNWPGSNPNDPGEYRAL